MLAGLISPTEGTIEIGGKPLFTGRDATVPDVRSASSAKPARDTLGSLGFVFQAPNLMPWRKVWRNIALPLESKGTGRAERKQRAEELAGLVGLEDSSTTTRSSSPAACSSVSRSPVRSSTARRSC